MRALEFTSDMLNVSLVAQGLGEAFQQFVADLLSVDYADLHVFPAAGKDGAIDLVATNPTRTFIECKYSAAAAPKALWNQVAQKLSRCLTAERPVAGQRQFLPWYTNGTRRIRKYIFCTSARLSHEAARDELREAIRSTFQALASRSGLAHLSDVDIDVLDWADLTNLLRMRPAVTYRWFPRSRPTGLLPIRDAKSATGFRSFLSSATLAYYSRSDYASAAGDIVSDIPSEEELLAELCDSEAFVGLLVTGKGGVGKTRLVLELGMRAEKSWVVLKADERVNRATISELLERSPVSICVLLVFDYVELMPSFAEVVEYMHDVNATGAHKVRFIANCRTSYYRTLESLPPHRRIELTPTHDGALATYRKAVVENILRAAGLVSRHYVELCRDIPVLAVFLLYLARAGKQTDLAELIQERDFGVWLARRVRVTFGHPVERRLATLMLTLPVLEHGVSNLGAEYRDLFDYLVADGWVEREVDSRGRARWSVVHDVLADRVAAVYIDVLRGSYTPFVKDVLALGAQAGVVGSAIVALQRVAELLHGVQWFDVMAEQVVTNSGPWASIRDYVVRSNLLSASERVSLLERGPARWRTNLESATLQVFLGLTCKAVFQKAVSLDTEALAILERWSTEAAKHAKASNYIFRQALRLFGAAVANDAIRWMRRFPIAVETHYVIVALLDSTQAYSDIRAEVQKWCEANAQQVQAQYVYRAWLDAGGELEVIAAPFAAWLAEHRTAEGANFAIRSWVKRKGSFDVVRDVAFEVVKRGARLADTKFVLHSVTEQRELPTDVIAAVLEWCRNFPGDEDVLWRLTRLRKNLVNRNMNSDVIETLEKVLDQWLSRDSVLDTFIATEVTVLVQNLVTLAQKNAAIADRCDAVLARWLLHPTAFELADALEMMQRPDTVYRVELVRQRGLLGPDSESAIGRFAHWVKRWDTKWFSRIEPMPTWLS